MMFNVYLGGPITGTSYEGCTEWRQDFCHMLPSHIVGISPMRGKEYLAGEASVKDSYVGRVLSCQKGITTRDRWDVTRCDAVVINFLGATRVSIGTVLELAWADMLRKPIILIMEDGNIHDHSMVRECAGFIVKSLDEAANVLKALFVRA